MIMEKDKGRFNAKLESNYEYRSWSIVEIDCMNYHTFTEIVEAIAPILENEKKEMKNYFERQEDVD